MVKAERILVKTTEQKVLGFIDENKLISNGDKLLIGLSGGPDSVFVLYFLDKYKKRFNITLAAAHINHSLRGEASDNDERFCRELAEKLSIEFYCLKADVKALAKEKKHSVEEAARNLRYGFFDEISESRGYNKIVTAHNMSDNAETVLLNLVKGTGLKGISGIPVLRGRIIRPLLILSKAEILSYLEACAVGYRIDESNKSNDYERNFIRNVLLPEIKENLNPAAEQNIFNSSLNLRNAGYLVDGLAEGIAERIIELKGDKIVLDLDKARETDTAALGEVLKRAVEKTFSIEFGFGDLSKIKSLIEKQAGRSIQLTGGVVVYRERNSLEIFRTTAGEDFHPEVIRVGESRQIGDMRITIKEVPACKIARENIKFGKGRMREYISADGLEEEFTIRRWAAGDKFIPLGMKSFKKISDFLAEQKIPASLKKKQLVLTNRDQIVWVPGQRIDNRNRISENSKRILEICLE